MLSAIAFWNSGQIRARAQAATPAAVSEGTQQFAEMGDFKLQNGRVIKDFRLGYRVLGELNAGKSNAILWPSWLGGNSQQLLQYASPKNVVDTERYFVVLVDAIGNGVSSSPSNSQNQPRKAFPEFTIRDMVEAEHRLMTEVFHLTRLHAVMGISMGGMQTFEWAAAYPDFMDEVIPIMGSPQSTAYDKLLWTAQIDAIELDPAWNNGEPKGPLGRGLALSEEIGSMSATSPEYRVTHTDTENFDAFLAELRENAKGDGGSAWNQIRQRQAIIGLDIPKESGLSAEQAAKAIHAKALVIVSPEDHTVNPIPAEQFAAALGAPVVTLNSPCGHASPGCVSLGPIVAKFLEDPSAVHSETIGETNPH